MRKAIVFVMVLALAAFGAVGPASTYGQETPAGNGQQKLYEWDTWPKKPTAEAPADAGKTNTDKTGAESDAGASVGSKAGRDASAGFLSGTTSKVILIGAVVIGGALALGGGGGGGGGGSTSNHP